MKFSKNFKESVGEIVRSIPKGKVMTYGQVATLIGFPRAAQAVGWMLHFSDQTKIPYQRVVNRFGGLAAGYTKGGREAHKQDLEAEGIKVGEDFTVDLDRYQYSPEFKVIPIRQKSKPASPAGGQKLSNLPFLKGP